MKEWIKTSLREPPQGKKVLCFHKGDVSVRQRFAKYWFPIPYIDSRLADIDPPQLWQEIDFPEGYEGYIKIFHDKEFYTIDEWEKIDAEVYKGFVKAMLKTFYTD